MTTTKPKISVIVPVYNVEKWLNKCIDSILKQSYKNFEVILVNDGSTDRSKEICESYSSMDDRVRVINIENSGQSIARNIGLKESIGDFIVFVDSDDYISDINVFKDFINILSENNYDFIYTSYCRFDDGSENIITEVLPINLSNNDAKNKIGKEILVELINKDSFHHAPYLKICRKKFIEKNELYFREGYYHEDAEWSFKVFYYAKNIFIYDKPWYMRRMRENSTITSRDEKAVCKKLCDRLIIADELIKFFEKENSSKVIINDLVRMYWGDLMIIRNIKEKENIIKCKKVVSSTKDVLCKSEEKKYLIGNRLIKYFGVNNFINLLKIARI